MKKISNPIIKNSIKRIIAFNLVVINTNKSN